MTTARTTHRTRASGLLLLLAALSVSPPGAAPAAVPPPGDAGRRSAAWQEIEKARDLQDQADLDGAAAAFERAERAAEGAGDKHAQAFARNCRAVLATERGRTDEAIALLTGLPLEGGDPRGHVYRYNLGRALEARGRPHQALKEYEAALWFKPDFEQAAERCFALLGVGAEHPDVERAVWAGNALASGGQPVLAARRTLDLIGRWGGQPGAAKLLTLLARCYAAAALTPARFAATDDKRLAELQGRFAPLAGRIAQLRAAYSAGEGDPVWNAGFSAWSDEPDQSRAMAGLLKTAGDAYAGEKKPALAAVRYRAAWRLDRSDADAVVYYAALLRQHKEALDPGGQRLRELVSQLFEEKSSAYMLPTRTQEDLVNLLRLHTILGSIFEQGAAGGGASQVYTAAFQWQRAADVQEQIRKLDPAFPQSARPYMKYAQAVRGSRPKEAWASFATAAKVFAATGNKQDAARAIEAAESLLPSVGPSAEQLNEFRKTAATVQGLPETSQAGQGRVIWVPQEYLQAGVDPAVKQKLIAVSDEYEEKARKDPLRLQAVEEQKRAELDTLLTSEQREKVQRARDSRAKEAPQQK